MARSNDHRFRRRVTAWDVARAAGVNQSVVSRAFNNEASVAPETRKRLLSIAKQLGYAPNALARGLLTGQTRLIGITMVQINSDVGSSLLQKLGTGLLSLDLYPLLMPVMDVASLEQEIPRLFSFDVNALVLVSAPVSTSLMETCAAWGRPVILLNRVAPHRRLHSIRTDDHLGGREAAKPLVQRGARKTAFVTGPDDATSSKDREQGFQAGIVGAGRPTPRIVKGDFTYASGLAAGRAVLSRRSRVDSVFCASDTMALGVLDAARELAVRVPHDLQVVGFDGVPAGGYKGYELTTFQHDLDAVARATAALLEALVLGSDAVVTEDRSIPAKLINRSSTRPL